MRYSLFSKFSAGISILILISIGFYLIDQGNYKAQDIKKLVPSEDHFLQKQFPETRFHVKAYQLAIAEARRKADTYDNRQKGSWEVQGPGNIGARANSVAVDPNDANKILVGYSEGGLFKTTNGGLDWKPVFDDQPHLSIGDVVFDPTDSDIAFLGTGDPNISGFPFIGDGIYKSINGGTSWINVGLRETKIISQIRISKQNHNTIYASAMGIPFEKSIHKGVYKSTNGGLSWKQVLFINDSTGVADLVIHPKNDNIVFACGWNRLRNNYISLVSGPDAKIYKSVDGGTTWKSLVVGLPQDNSSRVGIDISNSNPNILYACYTHPTNFNLKGIFKSEDGGDSWTPLTIGNSVGLNQGVYSGFGWYFGKIRINPFDPNDVFLLAVDLWRSKDGGLTWEQATPPWWIYDVHADKHDLIFQNNIMYLTTDGGVYKSNVDEVNWLDIENIPTTQFYRIGYNPHQPKLYYGGAQDNGTSSGNIDSINQWERIYGGDGFQPLFHSNDPNIFFVETQNGNISITNNGGLSFEDMTIGIDDSDPRNWDMPFVMSPLSSDILYTGTDKVYINDDESTRVWRPISPMLTDPNSKFLRSNISAIDASPFFNDKILVGTSDGLLWITNNSGDSWQLITNGLPKKYISSVSFSKSSAQTIYVTYTGYKDNDNTPYIYKSVDSGQTWASIQGDLPYVAINNIECLSLGIAQLYNYNFIGTDAGVYFNNERNAKWKRLGDNMPFIPVYDLLYNPVLNQIVAGTFGRGIQSFDLNQIDDIVGTENEFLDFNIPKISLVSNLVSNNKLSFKSPILSTFKVSIFNSNGQMVFCESNWKSNIELDISHLPVGIYFLSMNGQSRYKTKAIKFLKI